MAFKGKRFIIALVLVAFLLFLSVYYNVEHEQNLEHPSYGAITTIYPLGSVVHVYGNVVNIQSGYFTMIENYKGNIVYLDVYTPEKVNLGDKVSLLGVLAPDGKIIQVSSLEITELWNYYFLLLRSFLAFFILLWFFNRYWAFDRRKFMFRRR